MIRHPSDTHLPALKALWQEAFHDSDEDTAHYFTRRHKHENMLVFLDGEAVAGMLSLLPMELVMGETRQKARYIFAVATKTEYRGRGISTQLLNAAHDLIAREGGAAAVLMPAEQSLYDFYQKRGYKTAFYLDERLCAAKDIPAISSGDSIKVCSEDAYLLLRDKLLKEGRMYVRWDSKALNYIRESYQIGGGQMYQLTVSGQPALAVCAPGEDVAQVTELLCRKEDLYPCLALLHSEMKAGNYLVRTPAGLQSEDSIRPFGMVHWLREPIKPHGAPPYLSFAKD